MSTQIGVTAKVTLGVVVGLIIGVLLVGAVCDPLHLDGWSSATLCATPLAVLLIATEWRTERSAQVKDFTVPDSCLACDYSLDGLGERGTCPECGRKFEPMPTPIGATRVTVKWRWDQLPRFVVSVLIVGVAAPWIVPVSLAWHYARVEPWTAAWFNATCRPLSLSIFLGTALSALPMCAIAVRVCRNLPRWVFIASIASGVGIGIAAVPFANYQHLAWLMARQHPSAVFDECAGRMLLATSVVCGLAWYIKQLTSQSSAPST